jgi:hypothetical protein
MCRYTGRFPDILQYVDSDLDENTTLNDCFREKKDWRACKDEVR